MATSARLSKAGLRQARAYELFLGVHCRHVDNEYYGEPFLLEPWQRKHIWNPLFACGRMQGGRFMRKHRRVLIGLPRDAGKSETAAGILLTIAGMEPVHNGEYGVIASSKPQAAKTFGKLKSMIVQDPDLHASWDVLTSVIIHRETGATIMVIPYSEAATQSWHFNVCIVDEYHVHKSSAVLDAVISGQKSITNALTIVITTAGPKREGPLWDLIPLWTADPNSYVYWLGAKDTDKATDRKVWRKIKPMTWISMADMEDQFGSTTRRSFERYTLNRFPKDDARPDRALTSRQISRCVKRKSQFSFDRPFAVGVDGAQVGDAFAIICVQEDGDDVDFKEYVFDDPPEETGYYDLVQIEELLVEIYAKQRPLVAIDPSRLLLMAQHLEQTYRVPLVGVKQDNKAMCPAAALLLNAVKSGRARLGGCPKLAEHLGNAVLIEREPLGSRLGSTGKGESKKLIDAAIAAAIGMYALATQPPPRKTFDETEGFYSIPI
ncbi:MAG: terminase large subunit [Actinomycetota bacterium]|jgi:phage terminase large subunit-like protein|nr:terminase large subunit [Actinomycetota bacterium]